MSEAIVVLDAGSAGLKFGAYAVDAAGSLPLLCRGRIGSMQGDPHFVVSDAAGKPMDARGWGEGHTIDHKTAPHFDITWLEDNLAGTKVACFDSSYHRTMPEVAQTYALPQDVRDSGVRHWGYHGISYDYISRQLPQFAPDARRVIVGHLGGGASMCAMLDGRSVETTMGFAGESGLPMATRAGDVPPGALFYLLRRKLFDDASLEKMLYERAGLLGLSGSSGDMRVLQESADPRAVAAVEHFVYAMTKYVGAYTSVLGGLDALVFTAGIGEHSAPRTRGTVRQARVAWREAGQAGQRRQWTAHFRAGQRRVGLGHPHERRTDDRAAHAGADPTMKEIRNVQVHRGDAGRRPGGRGHRQGDARRLS